MKKGKLIVIEGIDQSGKKTQSLLLKNKISKEGYKAGYISFPKYNSNTGKLIKKCLSNNDFSVELSHILLSANRWEFREEIIKQLKKNDFLVCNRYCDSNIAYGVANGLDRKWLMNLDVGLPKSDLTILIDIPLTESIVRKSNARDRYEKNRKFLSEVRRKYKNLAIKNKWQKINGNKNKKEVSNKIWEVVNKKYKIDKNER